VSNLSKDYQQTTANWRAALAKNNAKTRWVIGCFILIYTCVGLLFDAYWLSIQLPPLTPLSQIFLALVTFKVFPTITCITIAIALISIWISFIWHDKIMLMGTKAKLITANSADFHEQQLYNVVEEMKVAAGLSYMPKIYIIKADYMNAFASGYSERSAMVAITKGLLEKLDRDELTAVMAHELSHIRHGDIKLTLMASVLSNLILIMIDVLFYQFLFSSNRKGDNRLFIIVMVLRYTLPIMTILLMLFLSRSREYMADAGCVELMRDNEPLARALMKIRDDSLQNKAKYAKNYRQTKHENIRREAYIFDPIQAHIKSAASPSDLFSTHPGFTKRLAALGFKKKSAD
jgi:heat shock protein HtpX